MRGIKMKHPHPWTPEEDAILKLNPTKTGSQLVGILQNRSREAINKRRQYLGIAKTNKDRVYGGWIIRTDTDNENRPITDETAYHVRKDYAAKRKLGYTHEKAIKWLVEANNRKEKVIVDLLENPIYDAQVIAYERKVKYTL